MLPEKWPRLQDNQTMPKWTSRINLDKSPPDRSLSNIATGESQMSMFDMHQLPQQLNEGNMTSTSLTIQKKEFQDSRQWIWLCSFLIIFAVLGEIIYRVFKGRPRPTTLFGTFLVIILVSAGEKAHCELIINHLGNNLPTKNVFRLAQEVGRRTSIKLYRSIKNTGTLKDSFRYPGSGLKQHSFTASS